jgi:hypothetical protein
LTKATLLLQEDTLKAAFQPFGNVQNIKLIKEKGGARK